MADYPSTLPQIVGTYKKPDSGKKIRVAKSGRRRVRNDYNALQNDFVVKHYLDATDADTLTNFYEANENIPFTFTYQADGSSYSCMFVDAPMFKPAGGEYFDVTVNIFVVV
jgi:hypothetical protein